MLGVMRLTYLEFEFVQVLALLAVKVCHDKGPGGDTERSCRERGKSKLKQSHSIMILPNFTTNLEQISSNP